MGLRCLLGHDFGDVEVEREREEDGNEMVVTIREVETCARCGTERVVSENKEVTSIMTPEEAGLDEGADDDAEAEEPTHPAVDDAEAAFEPTEDADDAVILEDDESEPEREPGQWPDAERPQSSSTPMQDEAGGPNAEEGSADEAPGAPTAGTAGDDEAVDLGAESDGRSTDAAPAAGEEDDVEILDADGDDDATAAATADAASEGRGEAATGTGAPDEAEEPDAPETPAAAGDSTEADVEQQSAAADADDTEPAGGSATAWPDHSGEDEGFDAQTGGGEGVSFSGNGLTPEVESEAADEDVEFIDSPSAGGQGNGRADPTPPETAAEYVGSTADPTAGTSDGSGASGAGDASADVGTGIAREESATVDLAPGDADTEYYCPNCGMTRGAGGSSMRAGDICPECRKGYVTERDA
ncbi:MAG: hypothetical protein ABEJ74_03790 [Haloferacaceae archaeon]